MAGLGISDLPWPTEVNRIDLLARGFETEQDSEREDILRARAARTQAARHDGDWGEKARNLADAIDTKLPEMPVTLASSRYFRHERIRFLSEIQRLLNESDADRSTLVRADVVKPKWACDVVGLQDCDPRRMLSEFRAEILRVAAANTKKGASGGGGRSLKGFLLAAVHGEFDPTAQLYQPHVHVAATQDYVDLVDSLRDLKGYKPTERVRTPVYIRRDIYDLPGALTYLLKSYWPERPLLPLGSDGALKRPRTHQRIREPFHTETLMWFDKWEVSDLILMMGLRVGKSGLNIIK